MRTFLKILLVLIFALPYSVYANIARSPLYGQANVMVISPMKGITVLHEDLSIEFLSPSNNSGGDIKVTAIYKINCPRFVDSLDLVFIANELYLHQYSVMLDGKSVAGQTNEIRDVPKSWLPPDNIQGDNEMIPYTYTTNGLISFRLDSLTEGEHVLRVQFYANSAPYYSDDNKYKSLVYILKPDTGWKDFDTLALHVYLPDISTYKCNLNLKKTSPYKLDGIWIKLPLSYFSIALCKSMRVPRIASEITIFLCLAILIFICCYWLYILAKYRIKNNGSRAPQIICCIIISILNFVIFPFIIFAINTKVCLAVYSGEITPYSEIGRGYIYAVVFGFPILLGISLGVTFLVNLLLTGYVRNKFKPEV